MTDSPPTLKDLGEQFGISRERVRQLEERMLGRLRSEVIDQVGEAELRGAA
jgi:RNA polymerase sigma-32 factor